MAVNECVKPGHLKITHWVAHPVLLIGNPASWQDVMVHPAAHEKSMDTGEHTGGFIVDVATVAVNLQCGEEYEECEVPEGLEYRLQPESMSVVAGEPFDNARAVELTRKLMIACGIPVEELVVVEAEEFFGF